MLAMTKDEFQTICEATWGKFWRRPAARIVRRDEKMIRAYAAGRVKIPDVVEQRLREAVDIGPAGEIIKALLVGKFPPELSHNIAREAAIRLRDAGLLRASSSSSAACPWESS